MPQIQGRFRRAIGTVWLLPKSNNFDRYNLTVPLDQNGQVKLFSFCDGKLPFKAFLDAFEISQGASKTKYDIIMTAQSFGPEAGKSYYLHHEFSNNYLGSEGGNVALWASNPEGNETSYQFELISAGVDNYYLLHKFSEKYLCSGETENGGGIWVWEPIPSGDEPRYRFKIMMAE